MESGPINNCEHSDSICVNELFCEVHRAFLMQFAPEVRTAIHAILASKILFYVYRYLSMVEGSGMEYRRDVRFAVYPRRKLLIVSCRSATGEPSFSVDIGFNDLVQALAGIGGNEKKLLECLAPLIQQTENAMREVRLVMATLKRHNS